ncbi:antibiotic biosynthesis monooxygenase [Streptomyces inhibens]|nr:antibiotic biosynthesis monooxygenase [Streptomyces inhibens]
MNSSLGLSRDGYGNFVLEQVAKDAGYARGVLYHHDTSSRNVTESIMKVGMIASHYPHPSHREEFISRVHRVRKEFLRTPGCLSADYWVSADGDAVISIVQWESEEASAASFAAVQAAGFALDLAYDERESRPREIVRLVAP